MQPNSLQKAAEIINSGSSGVICLPESPSVDAIAAATALYLGLTGIGKNVALASPSNIDSDLHAADKVQQSISTSGDNLVITFPFQEGSIDKVDYSIAGNNFNIVIKPGESFPKVEPKNVKFSYTGGTVDFIITVDVDHPRKLGELYTENQEMFKTQGVINIDRHLTNSFFGKANLVSRNISSTSELVLNLLQGIKVPVDKEIATNLYAGLVAATNNFSSFSTTAETFQTAADLLKKGAVKKRAQSKSQGQSIGPVENKIFSGKPSEAKSTKSLEDLEYEDEEEAMDEDDDWLKPKIFQPDSVPSENKG